MKTTKNSNTNRKLSKKGLIGLALVMVFGGSLWAQDTKVEPKAEYMLEIDPATFALNGYSFHFRFKPKSSDHFVIGAGVYAMDMPDLLVDFNKKNEDLGWKVRLNQGYGIFGEYHFNEPNKGWFAGAQTSLQEYKIENENLEGNEKFTNALVMAYAGYSWQLFDSDFYIKPWAGVGYTSMISGNNTLADQIYDVAPVTMFATLHLGYKF